MTGFALDMIGVAALASAWASAPRGAILYGAAGAALLVLAIVVGVVVSLRRRSPAVGGPDAGPVELGSATGRAAVVRPEGDPDGVVHAALVDAVTRGLGGEPPVAISAWRPGRTPDEDDRRARALAAKARSGVIVWGKVEGGALRLRVLAASAPVASEAFSVPVALPPPFDLGVAALVAAVGAETAEIADFAPSLAAAAEALAAVQAAPASGEDAARLRAIHARIALAQHALEQEAARLAAVLDMTATADPRRIDEPLEWAEVRAMRALALDRSVAGRLEPPLAELHDRARAWRDAAAVWTDNEASDRAARAAEALAVAQLASAERDGDVRSLDEAERRIQAAIAALGGDGKGPLAARFAALLGALRLRLGEREPRPLRLESAERELRRALVLAESLGDAALMASIRDDLARSLARLGERDRGAERLRAAAVIYRSSLSDPARDELSRARVRAALGRTLVHVGERDKDAAVVDEAVGALRMACNSFAAHSAAAQAVEARRALERAERLYAELRAPRASAPVDAG